MSDDEKLFVCKKCRVKNNLGVLKGTADQIKSDNYMACPDCHGEVFVEVPDMDVKQ